jgi:hypothetical protein
MSCPATEIDDVLMQVLNGWLGHGAGTSRMGTMWRAVPPQKRCKRGNTATARKIKSASESNPGRAFADHL